MNSDRLNAVIIIGDILLTILGIALQLKWLMVVASLISVRIILNRHPVQMMPIVVIIALATKFIISPLAVRILSLSSGKMCFWTILSILLALISLDDLSLYIFWIKQSRKKSDES